MRLRAIRVRDVGHFTSGAALEGLTGALDVLVAPNEAGKSTLFRALEAVFFERHTTTAKRVQDLTPHHGGSPLIEADFDIADSAWRITKQFGRGKKASLRKLTGTGHELRNADADEALAKLVGLSGGQPGHLGFLWVGQGQALAPDPPDLKRGEASAFQHIVEREVANLTGGTLLRQVRETVSAELNVLMSSTNRKPKAHGPFDLAIKRRDRAALELAAAHAAQAEAQTRRATLATLKARHQELSAPEHVAAVAEALAAAVLAHDTAVAARRVLKDAQHLAVQKDAYAREAEQVSSGFKAKLAEWHRLDGANAEGKQRLVELERALEQQQTLRVALEHDSEQLREREQRAHDALRLADQAALVAQTRLQLAAQTPALHAARALVAQIEHLEAAAFPGLSEAGLNQLVEADAARAHAAAALAGGAPKVTITYAAGAVPIRLNGQPVSAGVLPSVAGPLTLDIPGVGTITVEAPASDNRERHLDAHAKALVQLEAGLARLGVQTIEAARARWSVDKDRRADLEMARARLSGLAPEGIGTLAAAVAALTARLADSPLEVASVDAVGAQAELQATRTAIHDLQTQIKVCQSSIEISVDAIAGERAFATASEARAQLIGRELPDLAGRAPELARLAALAVAARAEANAVLRETAAVRQAVPDDETMDALNRTLARLQSEAAKVAAEVREIELKAEHLAGQEAQADEHGLSQLVPAREGALQRAQADVDYYQREVDALSLLAQTVQSAESSNRDRFLSPVMACLAPYLDVVFPGARVQLTGDFGVDALERAETIEELRTLSRGTQEQLAVLVRLAFANLLANAGRSTPLILDDALVYTDDHRLQHMFKALSQGAQHHQVLVLSCHDQTFSALGGHRAVFSAWEPS